MTRVPADDPTGSATVEGALDEALVAPERWPADGVPPTPRGG